MSQFTQLADALGPENLRRLRRLSRSEVNALRNEHRGIPEDYLAYLLEIGAGEVGVIDVLASPVSAEDVYGPSGAAKLGRILIVAFYDTGQVLGFDIERDWSFVEVTERMEVYNEPSRRS